MNRHALRSLVPVAIAALLVGCAPFASLRNKPEPVAPAAPPPPPPLPIADAMHRFTVEPTDYVVGELQSTVASKDDTLPDIARRFNLGYEEIVRANPGVDPWLPGEGTRIVLPTQFVLPDAPREGLVINLPAMRLFYYLPRKKGEPQQVVTHPIGVGKVGWATPEGTTKLVSRKKDPVWTPPQSVRKEHAKNGDILPKQVPAGPDNPLGRHMFRLGWPSYLVHGTNKPYGVGMRSSHGCIRLYPEDIEILFDMMPIGTRVTVVNQPFVLGWHEDQLYVQAFDVLEDDKRNWDHGPKAMRAKGLKSKSTLWQRIRADDAAIDWDRAKVLAQKPRGIPLPVMKDAVVDADALLAALPKVRNALPRGATWDGNEDQYADEGTFRELVADRDPATRGAAQ